MKARVFIFKKSFDKESSRLSQLGYRYKSSRIDNVNKCHKEFQDIDDEVPSWAGEMYARYYYDKNNNLIDIIALW